MTNGVAQFAQEIGVLGDEYQAPLLSLRKNLRIQRQSCQSNIRKLIYSAETNC